MNAPNARARITQSVRKQMRTEEANCGTESKKMYKTRLQWTRRHWSQGSFQLNIRSNADSTQEWSGTQEKEMYGQSKAEHASKLWQEAVLKMISFLRDLNFISHAGSFSFSGKSERTAAITKLFWTKCFFFFAEYNASNDKLFSQWTFSRQILLKLLDLKESKNDRHMR